MKQLGFIDFDNLTPQQIAELKPRYAARAVVFDNQGKVALLNVSNHYYHKLPGGGIEKGEDIAAALQRECQEEIGCSVTVTNELGFILEYRGGLRQESYAYLASVNGMKDSPQFTLEEIESGFKGVWVNLDDAIGLLESDKPDDYTGKYIQARDLIFLREARDSLAEQEKA
jgi:8-oxo-dGTP pyrophosphatase MutT (NUDIX family)